MRNKIISAFVVVVFLAGFNVMDTSGTPGEKGKWEAQMICSHTTRGLSVGEAKIGTSGDMKVKANGGCIVADTMYRVCMYWLEGSQTINLHDVGHGLVTSGSDAELKVPDDLNNVLMVHTDDGLATDDVLEKVVVLILDDNSTDCEDIDGNVVAASGANI